MKIQFRIHRDWSCNCLEASDTRKMWLLPAEINAESELMQALAEIDEDECPDDGAVEILLEDEYVE
jgi:hypothetical protein